MLKLHLNQFSPGQLHYYDGCVVEQLEVVPTETISFDKFYTEMFLVDML